MLLLLLAWSVLAAGQWQCLRIFISTRPKVEVVKWEKPFRVCSHGLDPHNIVHTSWCGFCHRLTLTNILFHRPATGQHLDTVATMPGFLSLSFDKEGQVVLFVNHSKPYFRHLCSILLFFNGAVTLWQYSNNLTYMCPVGMMQVLFGQ